jgi:hypothetical protein
MKKNCEQAKNSCAREHSVRYTAQKQVKQVNLQLCYFNPLFCAPPSLKVTVLRSAHTVYLCVLCGSQNKQRLFHCTTLTDWFV